jgi:hypothetical protein
MSFKIRLYYLSEKDMLFLPVSVGGDWVGRRASLVAQVSLKK